MMHLKLFCFILLLVTLITNSSPEKLLDDAKALKRAFVNNGKIVPNVISNAPKAFADVTYKSLMIEPGRTLVLNDILVAPNISYPIDTGAKTPELYTLLLVDPDVPAKPLEGLHWLVTDILGNTISQGKEVIKYHARPETKKQHGTHRYVLLVYKQLNGQLDKTKLADEKKLRNTFTTKQFVKDFNLSVPAVAGNYFKLKY